MDYIQVFRKCDHQAQYPMPPTLALIHWRGVSALAADCLYLVRIQRELSSVLLLFEHVASYVRPLHLRGSRLRARFLELLVYNLESPCHLTRRIEVYRRLAHRINVSRLIFNHPKNWLRVSAVDALQQGLYLVRIQGEV